MYRQSNHNPQRPVVQAERNPIAVEPILTVEIDYRLPNGEIRPFLR
jgi:hypothetical protein